MKKIASLFLLLFLYAELIIVTAQSKPKVAFTLTEEGLIPEGMTYDPLTRNFYVGSIAKRKILRINAKGEVSFFVESNRDRLGEVLGMAINPRTRTLWACSNLKTDSSNYSAVHVFDLETGATVKKYFFEHPRKSHLFNDICILSSNDVYITDSDGSGLYKIEAGSDSIRRLTLSQNITLPNGITASADEQSLYIASSTVLGIVKVDLKSMNAKGLGTSRLYPGILDGIYFKDGEIIGIQNVFFPEVIAQYKLDAAGDSIVKETVLAIAHPLFSTPTTGIIVDDEFYFIANSNVHLFENGKLKYDGTLGPVYIMKVKWK